MSCYRQLPIKKELCLGVESESDHDVFYFWYGIFEVFEIYCKGGGGDVEEKGGARAGPDQFVYFRSFCSKWSQQLLKITLIF